MESFWYRLGNHRLSKSTDSLTEYGKGYSLPWYLLSASGTGMGFFPLSLSRPYSAYRFRTFCNRLPILSKMWWSLDQMGKTCNDRVFCGSAGAWVVSSILTGSPTRYYAFDLKHKDDYSEMITFSEQIKKMAPGTIIGSSQILGRRH